MSENIKQNIKYNEINMSNIDVTALCCRYMWAGCVQLQWVIR